MRAPMLAWLLLPACLASPRPIDDQDIDSGLPANTPDVGVPDAGVIIPDGEIVYRTALSNRSFFSCSTCHALEEPAEDGLRRPGHPLGSAPRRPSFKNGRLDTLLEASNVCLTEWMHALEPWFEESPEWIGFSTFLESIAPDEPAPAIVYSIVAPPEDLAGGDADQGRIVFNETCRVCHGIDATGTDLGPLLKNTGIDAAYIARRVRTSGPTRSPFYGGLTGGAMPFWSAERLSDDELRDIIAFLLSP